MDVKMGAGVWLQTAVFAPMVSQEPSVKEVKDKDLLFLCVPWQLFWIKENF